MTNERLLWILKQIDRRHDWPRTSSDEERQSVMDQGFAFEQDGEIHLTSLGELEIDYPETPTEQPSADKFDAGIDKQE